MRTIDCDILIVGSGAGGGVLAGTLSELLPNRKIVVAERGAHYGAEFFNQREWDMRVLYAEKAGRTTVDGSIGVRSGECVGGGTTVNAMLSLDPVERVWSDWRKRYGVTGFSFDPAASDYGVAGLNMPSALAEVKQRINVHVAPDEQINENNRYFEAACLRYGANPKRFPLNIRNCIGAGFCTEGCSYDAKMSTAVTYLADAVSRGVQLIHHFSVDQLEIDAASKQVRGATGHVRETERGSRANSVTPGPLRIASRLVILAAGAVATPLLLARSEHPDPHARNGKGLVLHPSLPIAAILDRDIDSYRGIPGTMYCDDWYESHGFYLECLFGQPVYGAVVIPGVGSQHFDAMQKFRRIAGVGAMLVDSSDDRNRVEWIRGEARIHYQLTDGDRDRMRYAATKAVEVMLAGGSNRVMLPSEEKPGGQEAVFTSREDAARCAQLTFEPHRTSLVSAHCQASTKMSDDPALGVCNARGESHQVHNLVICDASSFPTSCGTNPMISILTMARYQGRRIAGELDRYV
jgi:choline dehydrogenase-like flavoprotein